MFPSTETVFEISARVGYVAVPHVACATYYNTAIVFWSVQGGSLIVEALPEPPFSASKPRVQRHTFPPRQLQNGQAWAKGSSLAAPRPRCLCCFLCALPVFGTHIVCKSVCVCLCVFVVEKFNTHATHRTERNARTLGLWKIGYFLKASGCWWWWWWGWWETMSLHTSSCKTGAVKQLLLSRSFLC